MNKPEKSKRERAKSANYYRLADDERKERTEGKGKEDMFTKTYYHKIKNFPNPTHTDSKYDKEDINQVDLNNINEIKVK